MHDALLYYAALEEVPIIGEAECVGELLKIAPALGEVSS